MEQGNLEYSTPYANYVFPEGSGGMVNSNVLHMTKPQQGKTIQLIHLFNPSLIGGEPGSRIEKKYIAPLTGSGRLDMIALYPEHPAQKPILNLIKKAFRFFAQEFGYEIKLREALTEIWLALFQVSNSDRKKRISIQKQMTG